MLLPPEEVEEAEEYACAFVIIVGTSNEQSKPIPIIKDKKINVVVLFRFIAFFCN
jgi:hypothetical protein